MRRDKKKKRHASEGQQYNPPKNKNRNLSVEARLREIAELREGVGRDEARYQGAVLEHQELLLFLQNSKVAKELRIQALVAENREAGYVSGDTSSDNDDDSGRS